MFDNIIIILIHFEKIYRNTNKHLLFVLNFLSDLKNILYTLKSIKLLFKNGIPLNNFISNNLKNLH